MTTPCIDILTMFGDQYCIVWDSAYNPSNVPRESLDLWYCWLTGRYGSIHPHSAELLAVETEHHPGIKKRLERLDCTTTYLDGDFGFGCFLFEPKHMSEIAEIVRLYRRPRISEARRAELRRNMKSVRSHKHGVLIKNYANPESGRYAPPKLISTDRYSVQNIGDLGNVCTSHVERTNLTIRTFMRRFTRLAMGFSKKFDNLEAAVQLHLAYYNFCWQLREKGKSGKLRDTPAMMAGLTGHVWTFRELVENVMGLEQDRAAYERYEKLSQSLFGGN